MDKKKNMKKVPLISLLCLFVTNITLAQVTTPSKVTVTPNAKKVIKPGVITPKPETIRLDDISEWLCPQALTRGDREFDGHGPKVKCNVTLSLSIIVR
jgi:hypothetical protein